MSGIIPHTLTLAPPRVEGRGPPGPIALVGEAPGLNETIYRRPFVGEAGQELTRILVDAGLNRESIYVTNVFKHRPPDNDILAFFPSRTHPAACLDLPAFRPGRYLHSDLRADFDGLIPELAAMGARTVVALGATALWALLGKQKISSYTGTIHPPAGPRQPFTVIPTYHPSAVLRNWGLRTTMVANLRKVAALGRHSGPRPTSSRQGLDSGPTPPASFQIKTNPTLIECRAFAERAYASPVIAVDVETLYGQLRTIAFSTTPTSALVIPFWEPPGPSYWPTATGELEAWTCVARALSGPGTKVFQNGLYDLTYLWRVHGISVNGPIHDTMLAHHAMEPELPKSLGAMASVYLTLPEWKTMRIRSEKADES